MSFGASVRRKSATAAAAAAAPGEHLQGQAARAADAARQVRDEELRLIARTVAEEVRGQLQPTLEGIAVRGARAVPITLSPTQPGALVAVSAGRLLGMSAITSSGARPWVRLYDGRSADDEPVACLHQPDAGAPPLLPPGGVFFGQGLYVRANTSAVDPDAALTVTTTVVVYVAATP